LQAFEAALKREPSRFWSVEGAARAAELSDDRAKAAAYYAMLVGQSVSADIEQYPALTVARAFLESVTSSSNCSPTTRSRLASPQGRCE
jgi:hypothetical protein